MLRIDPKEIKTPLLHSYLLGAVAPRPIAFASTIDKDGNPNLAPFSFFNAFSSNPPILVFSPARNGRTNINKHTFENIKEVPEVVINAVSYNIVQQASLASCEYPKGVNEFEKAGFTAVASEKIKPFRVKESPVQMECKVNQVIELGNMGGAGNLIICELVLMHINEDVLDENKNIDPNKIDLVSRMGGHWYNRASGSSLFVVDKPGQVVGIGIDKIPEKIRNSEILTGNNLGQLGNVAQLPTIQEVEEYKKKSLNLVLEKLKNNPQELEKELHIIAKELLDEGKVNEAWKTLLSTLL